MPAAVIFDLGRGGVFSHRPTAEFGARALGGGQRRPTGVRAAWGAGAGAMCADLKGGFGYAELRLDSGVFCCRRGSRERGRVGRGYEDRPAVGGSPTTGLRPPPTAERAELSGSSTRTAVPRWPPPSG